MWKKLRRQLRPLGIGLNNGNYAEMVAPLPDRQVCPDCDVSEADEGTAEGPVRVPLHAARRSLAHTLSFVGDMVRQIRKSVVQYLERRLRLLLRKDQGRVYPKTRLVAHAHHAPCEQLKKKLSRHVPIERLLCPPVLHELHPDHQAQALDVAYELIFLLESPE